MTDESKDGLINAAKSTGFSLAFVIALLGLAIAGMHELGQRDIQIARLEGGDRAAEQTAVRIEAAFKAQTASTEARLEAERKLSAEARARIFDRVLAVEGRETQRQQDQAVTAAQVDRMAKQLDRLTDALLPPNQPRRPTLAE